MRAREHRGGLGESMQTMVNLEPKKAALVAHINKTLAPRFLTTAEDVNVTPYCFDERIGWDTYIVNVRGFGPWGFTDGPLCEAI